MRRGIRYSLVSSRVYGKERKDGCRRGTPTFPSVSSAANASACATGSGCPFPCSPTAMYTLGCLDKVQTISRLDIDQVDYSAHQVFLPHSLSRQAFSSISLVPKARKLASSSFSGCQKARLLRMASTVTSAGARRCRTMAAVCAKEMEHASARDSTRRCRISEGWTNR